MKGRKEGRKDGLKVKEKGVWRGGAGIKKRNEVQRGKGGR